MRPNCSTQKIAPGRGDGARGWELLNRHRDSRTPRIDGGAIRANAHGLWPWILTSLGIHADYLKNSHGPCPGCGGRDRFRFDDRDGRGTFVCSGGGEVMAGDGFSLVMHAKDVGFAEALRMVADVLGRSVPIMASTPRREADDDQRRNQARQRAALLWSQAGWCESHPYLESKGVQAHGTRVRNGQLLVPVRDANGLLHSLQFISNDGSKKLLSGGRMRGCYHCIGPIGDVLCIAEGFATAASVHEAVGYATACAFSANNLKPVALALRAKFPEVKIILAADLDEAGLRCAKDAASAVGGFLVRPEVAS